MYRKALIALIAGGLLPLAFAPFYFFPFAVISPALLLYCWLNTTPKHGFWYGWAYGLGFFGIGVSWVYISMHRFGGMPVPMASFFTLLFVMVLALFPALQGYLLKRLFPKTSYAKLLLAFPISCALMDWLRSWLFSGFPWVLLGYSQTNSPLKGYAPIIGEYGLAFIITLTSGLFILSGLKLSNSLVKVKWYKSLPSLLSILLIWITGAILTHIEWTQPMGHALKVSLVQGNIPQQLKWQADFVKPTLERYLSLTQQHWDSDLIIWPEAAIPLVYQDAAGFINVLAKQAKQHHTRVLVGVPEAVDDIHFYNALYVVGDGEGHYYKRQLVPFGEYLPFRKQLEWILNYWQIPISTLLPGKAEQAPLKANGFHIAPYICYEIAYPSLSERIPSHTDFLVVVSNDAWFGESFAPAQHLQIAQFRALTTQRPALVATNNGVTAIIDKRGNIMASIPQFMTEVLTGTIQPRQGYTPILRIKSTRIIGALILILIVTYFSCSRSRRAKDTAKH